MPSEPRYSFIIGERFVDLSADALADRLSLLADLGYAGAELQLTRAAGPELDRLETLLDKYKLSAPSFLTGEAYVDGLRLCSPDPAIRKATIERLVSYLPAVKRFGAIMVVGLLQGLLRDEPDVSLAGPRISEGLRQVAAAADAFGVAVVIEPVNHLQVGFHNSVREVRDLIERVGSSALHPMVDTLHMNIEERSFTAPILACGEALRHVHLCESNGGRFGTGSVDFTEVLQALDRVGYRGWHSVKVYRGLSFRDAAGTSLEFLRSVPRTS
jgi:5-keto-L-gluconate epimerase